MRIEGTLSRDGKFWLADIPVLDAATQGRTRKEALRMVADLVETLADSEGFSVVVHTGAAPDVFNVSSSDDAVMVALVLRRQRQRAGLSLAGAAERLGMTSRNAYARYERGEASPTVNKLSELFRAAGVEMVLRSLGAP